MTGRVLRNAEVSQHIVNAPARSVASGADVVAAAVAVVVADLDRSGVLRFLIGESALADGKLGKLDLAKDGSKINQLFRLIVAN